MLSSRFLQSKATIPENDVPAPRLQVLLAGMNSLRATASSLRDELGFISKNVTILSNATRFVVECTKDVKQVIYTGSLTSTQENGAEEQRLGVETRPEPRLGRFESARFNAGPLVSISLFRCTCTGQRQAECAAGLRRGPRQWRPPLGNPSSPADWVVAAVFRRVRHGHARRRMDGDHVID